MASILGNLTSSRLEGCLRERPNNCCAITGVRVLGAPAPYVKHSSRPGAKKSNVCSCDPRNGRHYRVINEGVNQQWNVVEN